MHKECANDYIENFSPQCSVCGRRIRVWRLESLPPLTLAELDEDKKNLLNHESQIARRIDGYRRWRYTVWPHVERVMCSKSLDPRAAIMTIYYDEEYHDALVQRMMDAGMTRARADRILKDILWTHEHYDTFDARVKRAIRLGFRKRRIVDYAWP